MFISPKGETAWNSEQALNKPDMEPCEWPPKDRYTNPVLLLRSSPAWWLLRSVQTRSHPELGRQKLQRQWYYVSRPGRVGRRQACKERFYALHDDKASKLGGSFPTTVDAGWSSPVARQAHNLKVTGSNPVPATTDS